MLNKDCMYFDMFLYTWERVMKFHSEGSGIFDYTTLQVCKNWVCPVLCTVNFRIAVPSPCL
jgi:hypothetical protein